jgi:hypothetical protein
MEFRDVLWSVNEYGAGSGWHKDRLLLAGGAGMTLTADGGYRPFNEADKPEGFAICDVGMTLEIEYSTANVTDTDAELITCLGTLQNGKATITVTSSKLLNIYWGDGTHTYDVSGSEQTIEHTYVTPGEYEIIVSGVIEDIEKFETNAIVIWELLK